MGDPSPTANPLHLPHFSSTFLSSNSTQQQQRFINNNHNNLNTNNHITTTTTIAATVPAPTTAATSITPAPYHALSNNLQPRPSTPARFLGSSSPLPLTSAYALVSSTRNLGTPTSDIRATSPSSNINYQSADESDQLLNPPSTQTQPTQREWAPTPRDLDLFNHLKQPTSLSSSNQSNPDYLKQSSPIALPGVQNLLDSDLNCFWAILDAKLQFVYIDPTLKHRLGPSSDRLIRCPIYRFIHPADLDQFVLDFDLDRLRHPVDSSDERRDSQSEHQNQGCPPTQLSPHNSSGECEVGPVRYSNGPIMDCRFARDAHLLRLLATDNSSYLAESDDQYRSTQLLINPITHGHLLVFFHSGQDMTNPPGHPPYSPWTTAPFSACGIAEPEPETNYFNPHEVCALESAIAHSPIVTNFLHHPSPVERSSVVKQPPSMVIFLVLDSRSGRVLFSHHSLPSGTITDYRFCPEDYGCLAMQSKQQKSHDGCHDEPLGRTNCSRQLTGHHRLVKDGTLINIIQSFVIEYGTVTFAGFKSTLPSSPHPRPILDQHSNSIMGHSKPSPLELIHDSRPTPLDLYSPTSSRLARSHKRPRTDSSSEALTPQSACSTHSQCFSQSHYQRPSTHSSHQYPTFTSHHHHHQHPPPPQMSSLASNIPMPESPDPYGSQYTHFSGGELSPTMASAANVLGSFHRAHYHHPQSILALQDTRHHQISPPSSAHPAMIGYDNYGLQNLASMAATAPFDPPPPPPDFSSASSTSSPHPSGNESFGSMIGDQSGHMHSNVRRSYRSLSKADGMTGGSSIDADTDSLMTRGLGPSDDYSQTSALLAAAYRPMIGDNSSVPLAFHDNRASLKRPRVGSEINTENNINAEAITIRCCTSCGAQNSPEWRKGPNGVKSLCNACGLRFSRAQARKSKVPKNMSNSGNLKKVVGVINKKKTSGSVPQNSGAPVLGEEDSRLVIEGFRR